MSEQGPPPFPAPPEGRQGWPWTHEDGSTPLEPPLRSESASRVTVITPSFNQGSYLEEAIRSVVLQNHTNLEYFIMDGGSTDQSSEIIKRYEPWISYWVSEPDGGQADAINKGLTRATGEFVCWLNSDDVFYPGFVSRRTAEFADRPGIDLIYGDVHSGWDHHGKTDFSGESHSYLDMLRTLRVSIPQQSAMWRRSVMDRAGFLDSRWHVVLDRDFFLRIARHGQIEYIPGATGFFRQHPSAKSVAQIETWTEELPALYAELFEKDDVRADEESLRAETMAAVFLLCAEVSMQTKNWQKGLTHLVNALRSSTYHGVIGFIENRLKNLRRRFQK